MTFLNSIKKFSGLFLLLLGLVVIFYSIFSSYNIFTAKAAPYEVFKVEEQTSSQMGGEGIEAQIQEMIGDQLKGILPFDSISTLLNLIAWSIFAGILIFAGAQISGLGIKLIK